MVEKQRDRDRENECINFIYKIYKLIYFLRVERMNE